MRQFLYSILIVLLSVLPLGATNYYVSPTGDDGKSGLTEANAWLSLDNGDQKGILIPGDTVNLLPGTYNLSSGFQLKTSGTQVKPIIYRKYGLGKVIFNAGGSSNIIILMEGDHVVLDGLELTNTRAQGIHIKSDSCIIRNCYIHHTDKEGVKVEGSFNVFLKNIIAFGDEEGFVNEGPARYNKYYHNTVYSNALTGIELQELTSRIFNNIVALNNIGINGNALNICAYNNVWGNTTKNYEAGVVDSAGGLSVEPQFINPTGGLFCLHAAAPEIDAGLFLGYDYNGNAPDIGAVEMFNVYYVSAIGNDNNSGLSTAEAWLSLDNGDKKSILIPGDSVKVLAANYSFSDSIQLTTSGTADLPVTYCKHDSGKAVFDIGGALAPVIYIEADNVKIDNLEITNAGHQGVKIVGDSCVITRCNIHDNIQDGIYVDGDYNLILKNLVYNSGESGIENKDLANYNRYYGNTIYNSTLQGILVHDGVNTARIFNNILVANDIGILAEALNICGFNDVWGNTTADYYNGAVDSAGGLSVDPVFINPADNEFHLTTGSPVINAGLDLGYPYLETAPEMGAFEYGEEGSLLYIRVLPQDAIVYYFQTSQYSAYGYDINNNIVVDLTTSVIWSTTDPTGSITAGGLYTSGNSAAYYSIQAVYGNLSNNAALQVISNVNSIRIELLDGTPFGDTTLTTDNDTTVFYCRAYDHKDSLLGDVSATWSVTGTDSIGTVAAGPNTSTVLNLQKLGTGRVVATLSPRVDTSGVITCEGGLPVRLVASPDTATVMLDSTLQFNFESLDADGNQSKLAYIPLWTVLGGIGTINNTTRLFTATSPGEGYVIAYGVDMIPDTVGPIIVLPGSLVSIEIVPDSLELSADSTYSFDAYGYDAHGDITNLGTLTWEVLGGIGSIDNEGLFTPTTVGTGRIAVTSSIGGVTDTNEVVVVTPGVLARLEISPDTFSVRMYDTIQFTVTGYDAKDNLTSAGDITWKMLGRVGKVDSTGQFIAVKPGAGRVTAVSSINDVADSSGYIEVEELYVSTVPLGTKYIHPERDSIVTLAFRLDNYFDENKTVTGLTLRDANRGAGNQAQRLTNVDSVSLYLDRDNDSTLTGADSLLAITAYDSSEIILSIAPLNIPADSGRTILAAVKTALFARDGDSLDIFTVPGIDIVTGDGTIVAGPDTVNSLGYCVIDGMIAAQVGFIATGLDTISPADIVYPVLALDLPRNGYLTDTLKIISFTNSGTAGNDDFDSLVLYRDDGDNSWEGSQGESRLGRLTFTGSQWTLSGLTAVLEEPLNRFYVGAALSSYPRNGASIALSIPISGIDMGSQNDGPVDVALMAPDTIIIESSETVAVSLVPLAGRELIPGENTGSLLSFTLTNSYADTVAIDSLRCYLILTDNDGATAEQLESQIDSLQLYVYLNRTADLREFGPADTVVATAYPDNGTVLFNTTGLELAGNGGAVGLSVMAYLSADNCKDRNTVGVEIQDAIDIYFGQPLIVGGEFPLENSSLFIINAFPAGNIAVYSVDEVNHFGGQTNCLVFDFKLPGNGYADDILRQLQLVNITTLEEDRAIRKMNLWADATGNGFTPDDISLGLLTNTNSTWSLDNLTCPVPAGGRRFFVTVDVSPEQFKAGTMRLQIPTGGVKYTSDMQGPDDMAVVSPETHLLFPSNRVTVISSPQATGTLYPGSKNLLILTFALYNSYLTQSQTLQALNLTNLSRSRSGSEYADYETGQVSLYYDKNKDRVFTDDSLIGTGYFTDGKLQLSGLGITLPPESLLYFFVALDVPTEMIDSDSLLVGIIDAADFIFSGSVNVNGDLPLTRGGYMVVNGSIYSQYHMYSLTPRTISPGDTSVVLFAFQPAGNGNLADTLKSLFITNHGDADTSDITALELWLDINEDTLWQDSDSLVGFFTYVDSAWTLDNLDVVITEICPTLFILGDVSLAATPNVSFRGKIPVNGCLYSSDNDGPLDKPLLSMRSFPVSTSSLKITYTPLKETYTVGQEVEVRFSVTNILEDTIDNVVGRIVNISNPTLVTLFDSTAGPVRLAGGNTCDFLFTYTADQPGAVTWQMQAFAPDIPDSSVVVESDTAFLQALPENIIVKMINSIPTSVIRGQANVFVMNLQVKHPDTLSSAASVRIDSLILTVEDGSGGALNAGEVFSRLVLASGFMIVKILQPVPHQDRLNLVFSEPVIIPSGTEQSFSLLVNIDSFATADQFVIAVTGVNDIPLLDNNTLQPVTIDPGIAFPLKTATCRIDEPSECMMISYVSLLSPLVNYGQEDVDVLRLRLRHPESAGSSQIQLMSLTVQVVDSLMMPLETSSLLERISLKRQQTTIGEIYDFGPGSDPVEIPLSMPVTLSPGETDSITVQVAVKEVSLGSGFGMAINDSSTIVVRDISSGAPLDVTTDTAMLASGSVFPITSGWATLKQPAGSLEICLSSLMDDAVIGGRDSLAMLSLAFNYNADDEHSPLRIKNILVNVLDSLETPLNPDRLFDGIGYRLGTGPVYYQPFVDLYSGATCFNLSDTGLLLNPSDSLEVVLVGDIEADVPFSHFVLNIPHENNIVFNDATDTIWSPGLTLAAGCSSQFPFASETVNIYLPAGRPLLTVEAKPVQTTTPNTTGVALCEWTLSYQTLTLEGDLLVEALRGRIYKRTMTGLEPCVNEVFKTCWLLLDDSVVAGDSIFSGDSVNLVIDEGYTLERGDDVDFVLKADLKDESASGNYLVQFDDSTFLSLRDKNLLTTEYVMLEGAEYPLTTVEISLMTPDLGKSFRNYPNPFVPSRGEVTTITFNLVEDAHVDIEIFSITGGLVKEIAINSFRSAGSYQSDIWEGGNDKGLPVVSGTYFCRITARYVSGTEESFRRKIAVIR